MKRQSRRSLAEASAREADRELLARRLELLGRRGPRAVAVHENKTILVSMTKRGVLRIHRGYAYASDRVLKAVVAFVHPGTKAAERRRAERELVGFPVEEFVQPSRRPRRRERLRTGDRRLMQELKKLHERLNRRHFGGKLLPVKFRISSKMRTRLGELTVDPRTNRATEIAMGRHHIETDGWEEVTHTLLHEMVHQWQVESGYEPDHGETFRRKAVQVGVEPGARRIVKPQRRAARER
jgi:hypothetical protein